MPKIFRVHHHIDSNLFRLYQKFDHDKKDNHIYQTIPESTTIQQVLNSLYPAIFSTKVEAKYFLTILGDNILRKENSLIHIISSSAKTLINNLNTLSQVWFGTNSTQSFKFKYHAEHNYWE